MDSPRKKTPITQRQLGRQIGLQGAFRREKIIWKY